MEITRITDLINQNLSKKPKDLGKYSNLVIDHSMLEGKIKEITLDFLPQNEEITYDGYKMKNPGVLVVNIDLNTDLACEIDDRPEDCIEMASDFLGFDGWHFINSVVYPYVSKKYLNLFGFSFKDFPYIDFVVRNRQKQTLFYHDEDMETFIGSKNPIFWEKI